MPTKKVIFAEALLLSVRDDPEIDGQHFARFKEHIDHAPDAVKHGRWEWYEVLVNPYALCSNCGCGLDKRDALNFIYCPYCGAKMDLPKITEQTRNALEKMGEKAHGDGNG